MSVTALLTPRRVRGAEHLDDPTIDGALAIRTLADIHRSNTLFGGTRAVLGALHAVFDAHAGHADPLTLLDVGTGAGDIPAAARALAARRRVPIRTTGLERTVRISRASTPACGTAITGDALRLPFADAAFDIVTCSQVLHHFTDDDAVRALREMHRVARRLVVIGELRRSWLAAAGIWLASWPLAFHPVSRHDGVVSVMRGFVPGELGALVHAATGVHAKVCSRPGFRVIAAWMPR